MSSSSRLQPEATEFNSDSFWMDSIFASAFREDSALLFGDATTTIDNYPPLLIDQFPPSFGNDHPLPPSRGLERVDYVETTNEYNVPFNIQPEDLYVTSRLCPKSWTTTNSALISDV